MPRSPALQVVCVGRLRAPHDLAGGDYERRVGQLTGFRVDEVAAEPLQRGEAHARTREAGRIRDRLARNAWWGPPQLRVTVAGVPAFLAVS